MIGFHRALMTTGGVIIAVVSGFSLYSIQKIEEVQQSIYRTDYRLCDRAQTTRAMVIDVVISGAKTSISGDIKKVNLYDCTPDLHGGVAVRLTQSQRAVLLRRVLTSPVP